MFESLKRAIDEIFGSVIRPVKDWILRRSWGVRFACLIVIGAAAFAWWKPDAVTGAAQRASLYWRSWRASPGSIPLSDGAQKSLALAIMRLAPSVEADLNAGSDQASPVTPWSASQSVVALGATGRPIPNRARFLAYVDSTRFARDCFCWTELDEQPRVEVVSYVSGWIRTALAEVRQPLTTAEVDYLLKHQNSGGWWPMFPESGAAQYPSTYATAWVTLGLSKHRSAGLIPAERRAAVDEAIRRSAMWLMRSREGARWTAHPGVPDSDTPEALSGFTLHVLHQIGSLDLTDVDRAWLDSLPKTGLEPTSLDKHYMVLPYGGRRSAIDHVVEVRLPWILLATADAYASGTAAHRARTLSWLERVLRDPAVRNADTQGFDWVRAEVLIGMAETGKRAGCKACARAATGL